MLVTARDENIKSVPLGLLASLISYLSQSPDERCLLRVDMERKFPHIPT